MRYLKVTGQASADSELGESAYVVRFYDGKQTNAVYEETIKLFDRPDGRFGEGIDKEQAERIERFLLSRASSDLITVFERNLSGSPDGKSMELMAGGHNERGFAAHVRFRFFAQDGQMIKETTVTPPPPPVPGQWNCTPDLRDFFRGGSLDNPHTEPADPVDKLCENYIHTRW